MPPQRIIAQYLNINHSTVTRAYKGCEEKGLIKGIIGKGTFVSSTAGIPEEILSHSSNSFIDMGLTLPLYVAMFQKADRLLADQYTYTGLKSLAKLLGIILVPVASDSKGIDLKDLERSCRRESPKGIYLISDYHNPTGVALSMEKRERIRELIKKQHFQGA